MLPILYPKSRNRSLQFPVVIRIMKGKVYEKQKWRILNENIMGWTRIERKEIQCQYKRIRKQENGCARSV